MVDEKITSESPDSNNHLPTIEELGPYQSNIPPWLDRLWDYWTQLVVYSCLQVPAPNGDVLHSVQDQYHIDDRLADPDPSSHDVYLVSRPPSTLESMQMFASFEHWSVYTQGHFYHLTAPLQPRQLHKASREAMEGASNKPRLKHEDFSSPEAPDYVKAKNSQRKPVPLIAYKVGQTDHLPDQLQTLAQSLIDGMPAYHLWSANCQHFSIRLLDRTLVRLGDRSAFLGTATQIVDWDLTMDKLKPKSYRSVHTGFWIKAPYPARPTWAQNVKLRLRAHCVEKPREPWAIGRYTNGQPEGGRAAIKASLEPIKELKDDIKQKNWVNAWRGRPETWAREVKQEEIQHRKLGSTMKRVQADLVWDPEEERWKWKSGLSWKTLAIGIC